MSRSTTLFEDVFEVNALNMNGKKFERGWLIMLRWNDWNLKQQFL